jgi:hypothetical protein
MALTVGAGTEAVGRRLATLAVGGAGAAWIGVTALLARSESAAAAVPIGCPFKALTGLDCPGCGSTRSLGALTRFDLGAAFDHNVLVPGALVFLVASFVAWTAAAWRHDDRGDVLGERARRRGPRGGFVATDLVRRPAAIVAIGVVVVMFAVVRNLDAGAWLASGLSS